MAIGREQRQRLQQEAQDTGQDPRKLQRDLQKLEEGQEVSAEQAAVLQPQLGNAALAALLARSAGTTGMGADSSMAQEEEEVEERVEDEEFAEQELDGAVYGGGGGGGGGGGAGDPWDMGKLFGGDDDGDGGGGGPRNPRVRQSPIRPGEDEPFEDEAEEDDAALPPEDHDAVADDLDLPPRADDARPRSGDSIFQAVEVALQDPRRIGRASLEPEDLVDQGGPQQPLGRPLAIARFLADASVAPDTRAVARALVHGAAALLAPQAGASAAAARMATLAICAQAAEAEHRGLPAVEVDRAVALSQEQLAWSMAMRSARRLARRRRLHAPQIAESALGGLQDLRSRRRLDELPPHSLGGRAISALLPAARRVSIPSLAAPPAPTLVQDDALAAADAVLAVLTGGADPRDLPDDPVVDRATLQPVLDAASDLVNTLGRCQVEFAAAGIAAVRVHPAAPVRQILVHGDRALRLLAREIVEAGDVLVALEGRPRAGQGRDIDQALRRLREAAEAVVALRAWVLGAVSAAAISTDAVRAVA